MPLSESRDVACIASSPLELVVMSVSGRSTTPRENRPLRISQRRPALPACLGNGVLRGDGGVFCKTAKSGHVAPHPPVKIALSDKGHTQYRRPPPIFGLARTLFAGRGTFWNLHFAVLSRFYAPTRLARRDHARTITPKVLRLADSGSSPRWADISTPPLDAGRPVRPIALPAARLHGLVWVSALRDGRKAIVEHARLRSGSAATGATRGSI